MALIWMHLNIIVLLLQFGGEYKSDKAYKLLITGLRSLLGSLDIWILSDWLLFSH